MYSQFQFIYTSNACGMVSLSYICRILGQDYSLTLMQNQTSRFFCFSSAACSEIGSDHLFFNLQWYLTTKCTINGNKFIGGMKIFGDRYLPHMTTDVAESHINALSISKDLIKQTYHNRPPLKDPLYTQVRSTTILEMQVEL